MQLGNTDLTVLVPAFAVILSSYLVQPVQTQNVSNDMMCSANRNTCTLSCGNQKPLVNECDAKTLKWNCICPVGVKPQIVDQAFPIPLQQCQAQFQQCMADCQSKSDLNQQLSCATACNGKFKCGTAEAPAAANKSSDAPANGKQSLAQMASSLMALAVTTGFLLL